MTRRRDFLCILAGAAATLSVGTEPVLAQDIGADLARQLRRRGYGDIEISRTLLGRVRVVGLRGDFRREIIVNPNSGEILRDLTTDSRTGTASSSLLDDEGGRKDADASREDGGNSGRGTRTGGRNGGDDSSNKGSISSGNSSSSNDDDDDGGGDNSGSGSDGGGSDDESGADDD